MASGTALGSPTEGPHWGDLEEDPSHQTMYVPIHFDAILDPEVSIFDYRWLQEPDYKGMNWSPQRSGVRIPDELAQRLEQDWVRFLEKIERTAPTVFAEEIESTSRVHHLRPLAEVKEGYLLDPVTDLRPVCPNCHAMLHQRTPAYSIEEMWHILSATAVDDSNPVSGTGG
jgi:5-methylcytosine-specific restriction protein A